MMPRSKIQTSRLAAAVLACVAAVAACDSRQLTGPTARAPRVDVSEPIGLGSAFVSAPPNSGPDVMANLPYSELGIAVPESTWVVVRVEGSVKMSWNPACADQPPFWQCGDGAPFLPFGPDPGTDVPLQIFQVENGGGTAVGLRSTGGGGSAIGVFYQYAPGPLVGHLRMLPIYAYNPTTGGVTPSWLLSGGYTVTATAVPAPFTVTESAPEPDGTRTYTAAPLDGLQFSNPPDMGHLPPGYLFWAFYPGDSLPDRPDRTWPGWFVPECQFQTTCRYKPPLAGRMQVTAMVEWKSANARSKLEGNACGPAMQGTSSLRAAVTFAKSECVPPEQPLRLVVSCSPSTARRGDLVRCSATVTPEMPFTVILREATANAIAVSDSTTGAHAAGDTAVWAGTAVASTRVRISADVTVQGATTRIVGTSRFQVQERPWTVYRIVHPTVVHAVHPSQMHPTPPPFGVMNLTDYSYNTTPVDSVTSGPNAGVVYFKDQLQFDGAVGVINLHPALYGVFSAGLWGTVQSIWYLDQNGNGGPGWSSSHIYPACTQADMPKVRQELERHEGVTLAYNSHVGLANRLFQSTKLHERFERFYRQGMSVAQFRIEALAEYTNWWSADYMPPQKNFDSGPSNGTNATWAAIGCETDNDLQAP